MQQHTRTNRLSRAIRLYRPQRTDPQELESMLVAREPLLQEILGKLSRWQPGARRQHYLIIGPRGIGKTHLLQLIDYRIRCSPGLSKKWYPLSLSEESYEITRITDLLIQALRVLSEGSSAGSSGGSSGGAASALSHDAAVDADAAVYARIRRVYDQVRYDDNEVRVMDLALDALRRFHASTGCGILLMLENVNRILEPQVRNRSDIHLLRKILIEEDWLTLICTSTTTTCLSAVTEPEESLFEFFQVHLLPELTPDEQYQMLHNIASLKQDAEFESYLVKFRSRLQALYHFTGGNPRLTVMLYDLVAYRAVRDVTDELDFLLDQLTPFYQERMKDISSPLEKKVLVIMALMPEGCTPTELAWESRLPAKVVRAILSRLEKSGYVRREERRQKRTVYIIPERFFRIWHQMNHSRVARGRIRYLIEFFASWYATREERDRVWSGLTGSFQRRVQDGGGELGEGGSEDIAQMTDMDLDLADADMENVSEYMKYITAVSEGSERLAREFAHLRYTARYSGLDSVRQELKILDQEYRNDGDYFIHKGYFLGSGLGLHEDALAAFKRAIELNQDDIISLFNQARALGKLGRKLEARQVYGEISALLRRDISRKGRSERGEVRDVLLQILREDMDSSSVKIAAYLLGHSSDDTAVDKAVADDIIMILQSSDCPWRRQHCAMTLGFLGTQEAVEVLLEHLHDEADKVRGSAAAALGKIALEKPIPDLASVTANLIEATGDMPRAQTASFARMLLQAAFRSANLETVSDTIEAVRSRLTDAELFCTPHITALEYLQSGRDPAVMERQHLEMREAIQLLIKAFDPLFLE